MVVAIVVVLVAIAVVVTLAVAIVVIVIVILAMRIMIAIDDICDGSNHEVIVNARVSRVLSNTGTSSIMVVARKVVTPMSQVTMSASYHQLIVVN